MKRVITTFMFTTLTFCGLATAEIYSPWSASASATTTTTTTTIGQYGQANSTVSPSVSTTGSSSAGIYYSFGSTSVPTTTTVPVSVIAATPTPVAVAPTQTQTPSPVPVILPPVPQFACWSQGIVGGPVDVMEGAYGGATSTDYATATIGGVEYTFVGHGGTGATKADAIASAQDACKTVHPGTRRDAYRYCHLANCVGLVKTN